MTEIVTVPAEIIEELRVGLRSVLGDAGQGIADTVLLPDQQQASDCSVKCRKRIEHTCALLDAIGWWSPEHPVHISVDANEHRWALKAALRAALCDAKYAALADGNGAVQEEDPPANDVLLRPTATGKERTTTTSRTEQDRVPALREFAEALGGALTY